MSSVDVTFELEPVIEAGLANGTLERVGGVIRNSDDKQIVAWLTEIGENIPPESTDLVQRVLGISSQALIQTTVPLLNLSVVGLMWLRMEQRFNQIASQISTEFNIDRESRFQTALDMFELFMDEQGENPINNIIQAKNDRIKVLDKALESPKEILGVAGFILNQILYLLTLQVYTHKEEGKFDTARKQLQKGLEQYKPYAEKIITAKLGQYPSIYLHPKFELSDVKRFLRVRAWQLDKKTDDVLEILDELRQEFWNDKVPKAIEGNVLQKARDTLPINKTDPASRLNSLLEALTDAEAIIENFNRLQGFDLELREERLSQGDFATKRDEARLEYSDKGVALIYDKTQLERLSRLSS